MTISNKDITEVLIEGALYAHKILVEGVLYVHEALVEGVFYAHETLAKGVLYAHEALTEENSQSSKTSEEETMSAEALLDFVAELELAGKTDYTDFLNEEF